MCPGHNKSAHAHSFSDKFSGIFLKSHFTELSMGAAIKSQSTHLIKHRDSEKENPPKEPSWARGRIAPAVLFLT